MFQDECSFVSLRDVERGVQVLAWFYSKMDLFYPLIEKTKDSFRNPDDVSDDEELDEEDEYESLDEEEEVGSTFDSNGITNFSVFPENNNGMLVCISI